MIDVINVFERIFSIFREKLEEQVQFDLIVSQCFISVKWLGEPLMVSFFVLHKFEKLVLCIDHHCNENKQWDNQSTNTWITIFALNLEWHTFCVTIHLHEGISRRTQILLPARLSHFKFYNLLFKLRYK